MPDDDDIPDTTKSPSTSFTTRTTLITQRNDQLRPNLTTTRQILTSTRVQITSSSTTTTRRQLIDNDDTVCYGNYPRPNNHNKDNIVFNVIPHETIRSAYKVGSKITFTCQLGFYVYNSNLPLTTTCLSVGAWSNLPHCKYLKTSYNSNL